MKMRRARLSWPTSLGAHEPRNPKADVCCYKTMIAWERETTRLPGANPCLFDQEINRFQLVICAASMSLALPLSLRALLTVRC